MIRPSLTPELCCIDIQISLNFYTQILGFSILYQREEDGFAMLERQGARIMLDQLTKSSLSTNNRNWLRSPDTPFGNGVNFEIVTDKIDELYASLLQAQANIYLPIENKSYRAAELMLQRRQFIVLDPDGYMLRFSQDIDLMM